MLELNNKNKKNNQKDNNKIIKNIENKSKNDSKNESKNIDENDIIIYDIEEGYLTVKYNNKAKLNNYNFKENLKIVDGFYNYKDDNYESILGIDVSEYQGEISWNKVKKCGIEFAILRLGYRGYGQEGKIILDEKFEENYENAKKEGIKLGVYFFSQALNIEEVQEEARFVLDNLNGKQLDFPVVFDLEKIKNDDGRTDNLNPDEINTINLEFCKIIKNNGFTPAIYGNAKTFTTMIKLEQFNEYMKWYADYQEKPLYPYDFTIWQYSEDGNIDGIDENVDIDLYFKKSE